MNGEWMAAEMAEQPRVLHDLVVRRHEIRQAVRDLVGTVPSGVVFAARGSSANAARHGCVVAEVSLQRPAFVTSLSVGAAYGVDIERTGWLGIAVSQSGRTPEIVAAAERMRRSGAFTIGVTNDGTSPLSDAVDICIDLRAGTERAVPATKTYTAQVAALAMIVDACGPGSLVDDSAWERLADAAHACLDDSSAVEALTASAAAAHAMVVAGRGFGHPPALEGALKIKELTGIAAEAYSHLALLHGPVAVVGPRVPAIVVALRGPTSPDSSRLVETLEARGAPVWTIGDVDDADVPIGSSLPEPLNGILVAIRMQQLSYRLSRMRGIDPDAPHDLSKVTVT